MTLGLVLRVYGDRQSFDRTFPRPPVLIGREPGPSRCVLDDPRVSKLHASIDIRGGSIWVRDAGSTNGTFVAGQRLEPNRWIPIGPVQQPVELRLSTWRIQAFACEVDAADPSLRSATLGELLESAPRSASMLAAAAGSPGFGAPPQMAPAAGASRPPPSPDQEPPRTLYSPEAREPRMPHQATYDMRAPVAQIAPVYARLIAAMNELYVATTRELDAMPAAARPHVCRQIAAAYPIVALDPSFQTLFRHYGWPGSTPPPPNAASSPLASSALDALQDLAGWYVGRARPLSTEGDVTAFKEKLRAAMDELIVGYVPLLAGMMRFEHQMALRADTPGALPASPTEMAARLLDWNDRSDDLVVRLRGSFADLMMHQVALLNGVMSGVKALLTELAPGTIEKAAMREQGRRSWIARLFSRVDAWDLYKRRHSDLADEENERFRLLFGAEFADEYRQFVKEARDAGGEVRAAGIFPSSPPPPGALPPAGGGAGLVSPRGPTIPPAPGGTLHSSGHAGQTGDPGPTGAAGKGTGQRPGNSGTR